MPEMPKLFSELVTLINRMPPVKDHWKRLRIAVTAEELAQFKEYIHQDGSPHFIWALRGVPLILDEAPEDPVYILERFENAQAPSQSPSSS